MPANQRVSTLLTYTLAVLSSMTFEVVLGEPERAIWLSCVIGISKVVLALLAGWLLKFSLSTCFSRSEGQDHSLPIISGLVVAILSIELITRAQLGLWLPLELLLLLALQAVMMALVIISGSGNYHGMVAVMSTFLILFSAALGKPWWLQILVLGYLAAGIWWLMGKHWESLHSHLISSSSRKFPRSWLLIVPLLLGLTILAIPLGYAGVTGSLSGFMPSSGGNGDSSPWARGGVNDGDTVIAGTENVKSFAPIDDAPFMTSHDPSLYDLFDDSYNEPVIPKNQDRAIALPRQFRSTAEQKMAKAQTGGRPFSMLRKSETENKTLPTNISTDAVAFLVGRVPLHLSLQTFAVFDGVVWQAEAEPSIASMQGTIQTIEGKPWFVLPVETRPMGFDQSELHAIKLVQLDTNAIPSPPGLEAVMIDQLTDATFYRWASPGRLRLDRERLPDLTVIHLQSAPVAEKSLRSSRANFPVGAMQYLGMPDDDHLLRLEELAEQITKPYPRGWSQIAAIRDYVRSHYQLDREIRPPVDCENVPAWFLFDSKRGSDYHFAAATAMLLRAAGYPSRLVTGLYARDDRYDYRLRHTAILQEDVHTWVEIHAGLNWWVTVEPTPGYKVLQPVPTISESIMLAIWWSLQIVWQNFFVLLASFAMASVAFWQRHHLLAEWKAYRWRKSCLQLNREALLEAGKILSLRFKAASWDKPDSCTLGRWLQQIRRSLDTTVSRIDGLKSASDMNVTLTRTNEKIRTMAPALRELSRLFECFAELHDAALYGPEDCFERLPSAEAQSSLARLKQLDGHWSSWRLKRVLTVLAQESERSQALSEDTNQPCEFTGGTSSGVVISADTRKAAARFGLNQDQLIVNA